MSSIVPRYAIRRYGPPLAGYAMRAFRRNHGMYGRVAKRTARRVYRARKRRRFRAPNPTSGTATAKRTEISNDNGPVARLTKSLNQVNLAAISHSANNTIDERQRNILNLRGVKMCLEVHNTQDDPLYYNCAVIVPKLSPSVSATGFFRGNGADRDVTFGTSLTGLQLHCLPINADKHYVLWHKRYKLNPISNTGYQAASGKSYMTIKKYLKFKRQVRYSDNADTLPEGGVPYFISWCSLYGEASGAGVSALAEAKHFVTYFREPR